MITEIIMPKMGQTMEEGTIHSWLKQEGDAIKKGEVILVISTDKAEIEVESAVSGVLKKILCPEGETVPVKAVIALAGDKDDKLPPLDKYEAATPAAAAPQGAAPAAQAQQPAQPLPVAAPPAGRKFVSPRARKLAAEKGIDTNTLEGTGPDGRVVEADVKRAADALRKVKISPVARKLAAAKGVDITKVAGTGPGGRIVKADIERASVTEDIYPRVARTVPLTQMRRIIGERMSSSKFSAPHFYVTFEVDMANAAEMRARIVAETEKQLGFRVSPNDIIIAAVAKALGEFPRVNARLAGDAIELLADVNIGVAVALDDGLIVPVLRKASEKTLVEIAAASRTLVDNARKGKLLPDDFVGGTFTVSNMGMLGVEEFTAIINQPESGILAVGRIADKVVAVDGKATIRPLMKMTMSCDHRVVDGALGAQFLSRVKELLENPDVLES